MREHAVVIAGGGPTGLMLAGELSLAGVDVAVVERRTTQDLDGSRAGGLQARTIEILDQRGIADRFLSQGQRMQINGFGLIPLDISDFPTRHNYGLALWQNHIERILAEWVEKMDVRSYRPFAVTGFTQDDTGVNVALDDGHSIRAQYLVGCDGGRSVVRKTAGIDFPGWDASISWLIAEVETAEEPKWGFHFSAWGDHGIGKAESGRVRMVLTERHLDATGEPTLSDLSDALVAVFGTDFGVHSPAWISRFNDTTRHAATYRKGRVFLAGDAANVRPPIGGQGLNLGMQDAVNLGWKLAQVVKQISPDEILDTYHAERHPVVARVLRNVMAQVALRRVDERTKALKEALAEVLPMDGPRRMLAGLLSGLDVHYDLGEGHPLLGRRMPDLDLTTASGPKRVYTLLHAARPVLINFGAPGSVTLGEWSDRVRCVDATYDGLWEVPVVGRVVNPTAVFIRPDGYVAWVADGSERPLAGALARWTPNPGAESERGAPVNRRRRRGAD